MTNLGCNAESCGYNRDNLCCRDNIVVGGCSAENKYDTMCTSYKECSSCSNSTGIPNNSLDVDCDAVNCKFNEEHRCSADHITISGSAASNSTQTLCSSFLAK